MALRGRDTFTITYDQKSTRPQGYKTFFMVNSTEHELSTAQLLIKTKILKKNLALNHSDLVLILLITVYTYKQYFLLS